LNEADAATSAHTLAEARPKVATRRLARGDIALPSIAVIAVAVGLTLDRTFGWPGHVAADLFVAAGWLLARCFATIHERREQILCVILATAGELFLCFGWGLYEYRFFNIPVYVPLGHSLIFLAGLRLARFAPAWSERAVPVIATIAVFALALRGDDRLGVMLLPLFLACLLWKRARRLYAVMFAVSFLVEVAGTRAEAWRWMPVEPVFGLTLTNPPVCAGTFYCVLDLLVALASHFLRTVTSRGSTR
jgi:hypothetical protein